MKAVICTRYGPPEVLRLAEVEAPTPGRNHVGIRVGATTVTFSDCMIRGLFLRAPWQRRILMQLVIGWKRPRRAPE